MKIAIVGTRGIPNNYGGLEEFAENVSVGLVKKGHQVIVYNPHFHPHKESTFHGVEVVKKWSPEKQIGTAANFIYDYLSLRDALKRKVDAILICGYTTSAISLFFIPLNRVPIFMNIDGMEWWRAKWSPMIQKLTHWFEKVAVKRSHVIISDNLGIKDYVQKEYNKDSYFLAYAANEILVPEESSLQEFGLQKYRYNLLIGRLEPENNIETILDGVRDSSDTDPTVIFANYKTKYGQKLKEKYAAHPKIEFRGWASGQKTLNNLRHFAKVYFHGHSVGGTNPSLLEAMAGRAFIAAHNNPFNSSVLEKDALYFRSPKEVQELLDQFSVHETNRKVFTENNINKIRNQYNWPYLVDEYEKMFLAELQKRT
ncbi:MAG TPA: DUF1972 domain-containing protein [Bacteroidia bacterium]|nr:DUF1972 domain-containing protein [Bacteroidia bacterium]HNT79452.1 DUF1972 domain-containing protein [Bacteroidia bacterium]